MNVPSFVLMTLLSTAAFGGPCDLQLDPVLPANQDKLELKTEVPGSHLNGQAAQAKMAQLAKQAPTELTKDHFGAIHLAQVTAARAGGGNKLYYPNWQGHYAGVEVWLQVFDGCSQGRGDQYPQCATFCVKTLTDAAQP